MLTPPAKRGRGRPRKTPNSTPNHGDSHTPLATTIGRAAFHPHDRQTANPKRDIGTTGPDRGDATSGNENGAIVEMVDSLPPPESEPAAHDEAPKSRRKPRAAAGEQAVIDGLTSLYTLFGIGMLPLNQYDGQIIMASAAAMAASAVHVGRHNPRVMRVLRRLAVGSEWGEFAVVHVGVVVALGANHGMVRRDLPAAFNLPVPPEPEARSSGASGASGGPPPETSASFNPGSASASAPVAAEEAMPGTHITPEIANRIAEQALAAAIAEQQAAMANGAEGVPRVNPSDLTGEIRRI